MEAVQQKVSLSQQLEEMEVNMDIFLQEQVKDKLVRSQSDTVSDSASGKDTLSFPDLSSHFSANKKK